MHQPDEHQSDQQQEDNVVESLSHEEEEELLQSALKLKEEGNSFFKEMNFEKAVESYSNALQICPMSCTTHRSVLFNNRATARASLNQEDRDAIVEDCTQSLELNESYVKPRLRRAQTYREMGSEKWDASLEDYKKVIELCPDNTEVKRAIYELEQAINERNENLKKEMLDKLKDLGNLVLRPFGLSTDNFQLNQNDSGGYSVNFKPDSNANHSS